MIRNLNHFITFAALAETGSFAGAARRLGLPTSTVSEHVAALERALGLQLVVRTTRNSRLTDPGRRIAAKARDIVTAADAAMAAAEAERTQPEGSLRISLPFAFAADLLGPAICGFGAAYPGIALDFVVSNEVEDLIAGGFDLAIRIGPLDDSSLNRRVIGTEPQHLVAGRRYLERRGRPLAPADLADHQIVGFRPKQTFELTGPDGTVTLSLIPAITANDPKMIASIVAGGGGIAVLPRFLVDRGLSDGSLDILLPDHAIAPVAMSVVHYGSSASAHRVALFTNFLQEHMRRTGLARDTGSGR